MTPNRYDPLTYMRQDDYNDWQANRAKAEMQKRIKDQQAQMESQRLAQQIQLQEEQAQTNAPEPTNFLDQILKNFGQDPTNIFGNVLGPAAGAVTGNPQLGETYRQGLGLANPISLPGKVADVARTQVFGEDPNKVQNQGSSAQALGAVGRELGRPAAGIQQGAVDIISQVRPNNIQPADLSQTPGRIRQSMGNFFSPDEVKPYSKMVNEAYGYNVFEEGTPLAFIADLSTGLVLDPLNFIPFHKVGKLGGSLSDLTNPERQIYRAMMQGGEPSTKAVEEVSRLADNARQILDSASSTDHLSISVIADLAREAGYIDTPTKAILKSVGQNYPGMDTKTIIKFSNEIRSASEDAMMSNGFKPGTEGFVLGTTRLDETLDKVGITFYRDSHGKVDAQTVLHELMHDWNYWMPDADKAKVTDAYMKSGDQRPVTEWFAEEASNFILTSASRAFDKSIGTAISNVWAYSKRALGHLNDTKPGSVPKALIDDFAAGRAEIGGIPKVRTMQETTMSAKNIVQDHFPVRIAGDDEVSLREKIVSLFDNQIDGADQFVKDSGIDAFIANKDSVSRNALDTFLSHQLYDQTELYKITTNTQVYKSKLAEVLDQEASKKHFGQEGIVKDLKRPDGSTIDGVDFYFKNQSKIPAEELVDSRLKVRISKWFDDNKTMKYIPYSEVARLAKEYTPKILTTVVDMNPTYKVGMRLQEADIFVKSLLSSTQETFNSLKEVMSPSDSSMVDDYFKFMKKFQQDVDDYLKLFSNTNIPAESKNTIIDAAYEKIYKNYLDYRAMSPIDNITYRYINNEVDNQNIRFIDLTQGFKEIKRHMGKFGEGRTHYSSIDPKYPPPREGFGESTYETTPGGDTNSYKEVLVTVDDPQNYSFEGDPGHWGSLGAKSESADMVGHITYDTLTDTTNGEKTLLVQEFQSTYIEGLPKNPTKIGLSPFDESRFQYLYSKFKKDKILTTDELDEFKSLQTRKQNTDYDNADSPFKETWPALLWKKTVEQSISEGATKIQWMDGEFETRRNLMAYHDDRPKLYIDAEKNELVQEYQEGYGYKIFGNKSTPKYNVVNLHDGMTNDELSLKLMSLKLWDPMKKPVIGIIQNWLMTPQLSRTNLDIIDLEKRLFPMAEGIANLYDRQMVSIANRWAKKLGVGPVRDATITRHLDDRTDAGLDLKIGVHEVDFPQEKFRDASTQGQYLYRANPNTTTIDMGAILSGTYHKANYPGHNAPMGSTKELLQASIRKGKTQLYDRFDPVKEVEDEVKKLAKAAGKDEWAQPYSHVRIINAKQVMAEQLVKDRLESWLLDKHNFSDATIKDFEQVVMVEKLKGFRELSAKMIEAGTNKPATPEQLYVLMRKRDVDDMEVVLRDRIGNAAYNSHLEKAQGMQDSLVNILEDILYRPLHEAGILSDRNYEMISRVGIPGSMQSPVTGLNALMTDMVTGVPYPLSQGGQHWLGFLPSFTDRNWYHTLDTLKPDNFIAGRLSDAFNTLMPEVVEGKTFDPISNIVQNVLSAHMDIQRNIASKHLVDAMKKLNPDFQNRWNAYVGDPTIDISDMTIHDQKTVRGAVGDPGKMSVTVYNKGQPETYYMPEGLVRAFKDTDVQFGNIATRILSRMAGLVRKTSVVYNPSYVIPAIARDLANAKWMTGADPFISKMVDPKTGKISTEMMGWFKFFGDAFSHGNLWRDAADKGLFASGITGYSKSFKNIEELYARERPLSVTVRSATDIPRIIWRLVDGTVKAPFRATAKINEAAEQASRMMVYHHMSATNYRGLNELETVIASRDAQVDFDKSGSSIKLLNQLIPFLNAGVQGSTNVLRQFWNPATRKEAFLNSAYLGIPAVMLYFHNSSYKTFQQIPSYEFENNWIFMLSDTVQNPDPQTGEIKTMPMYVKLPKGNVAATISAPIEWTLRLMDKTGDTSLKDDILSGSYYGKLDAEDIMYGIQHTGAAIAQQMNPMQSGVSNLLPAGIPGGIVQTIANKDLYRGTDIVPATEQNRPPGSQFGPNEKPSSILLTDAVNNTLVRALGLTGVSPRQTSFMLNESLGGAGQSTQWMLDWVLDHLGYDSTAPGELFQKQKTFEQNIATAPIVSRLFGVRSQREDIETSDALNKEVLLARNLVYGNQEVRRLGIGISFPAASTTLNGKPIDMTNTQRLEAQRIATGATRLAFDRFVNTDTYTNMNDEERKICLQNLRSRIWTNAKNGVLGKQFDWNPYDTEELVNAAEIYIKYQEMPRYKGLTPQDEQLFTITNTYMEAFKRRYSLTGQRGEQLAIQYIRNNHPELLNYARRIKTLPRKVNKARSQFYKDNAEIIQTFFSDTPLEEAS